MTVMPELERHWNGHLKMIGCMHIVLIAIQRPMDAKIADQQQCEEPGVIGVIEGDRKVSISLYSRAHWSACKAIAAELNSGWPI